MPLNAETKMSLRNAAGRGHRQSPPAPGRFNVGLAPPDMPLVRRLGLAIQTPPDALGGIRFTKT
jgi:hypothetical protein